MGAGNVKLVFANWAHLEHHPFRVLVYMALTTKDTDQPARYWDRWESLAVALGRMVPDETDGDETVRLDRQAALRAVNRATAELLNAGAVTLAQRASPGRNTVYELNLMPERTVDAERRVNNRRGSMKRSTLDGNNGRRSVVERSTLTGQTVDAERPSPRKEDKDLKEKPKEEMAGVRTDLTVLRASEAASNPRVCPHGRQRRNRRNGEPRCDQCREARSA